MESIELLLQIIVDESSSVSGLEDDAAAWVRDVQHRTPHKCDTERGVYMWNSFLFSLVGAISAEGTGVQQAAGCLEQVRASRPLMC